MTLLPEDRRQSAPATVRPLKLQIPPGPSQDSTSVHLAPLPSPTHSAEISSPFSDSFPHLRSFEDPEGDLIVRSCDNVQFRIVRYILTTASPVLATAINNPRPRSLILGLGPPEPPAVMGITFKDDKKHTPIASLSEDGRTLEILLRICFPVVPHDLSEMIDHTTMEKVLKAGQKYEMKLVVFEMRRIICQKILEEDPKEALRYFVLARKNKLLEETMLAARVTLKTSLFGDYFPELESISAGDYHRLLDYHKRVSAAVSALFLEDGSPHHSHHDGNEVTTSSVALNNRYPELFACKRGCGRPNRSQQPPPSNRELPRVPPPARWWNVFSSQALHVLQDAALSEEIFSIPFLRKTLSAVQACPDCESSFFKGWEVVVACIKAERERVVDEIALDLDWY